MPKSSLDLLPPMRPLISIIGEPVRAAGWYGPTRGLHTVSVRAVNFVGLLFVEATLSPDPSTDEWFSVLPDAPVMRFPRSGTSGETVCLGFSFRSNCLWLRARMDRSAIIPPNATEAQIARYGILDTVRLNYIAGLPG
jgi:hypothetical protein